MSVAKSKKVLIYFCLSLFIVLLTKFIFAKIINIIQPAIATIEIALPANGD